MNKMKLIRWVLTWNACCGAVLLMAGMVMCVAPYSQLDAVLTSEELADPAIRETMQARLLRNWGNSWLGWCIAGGAVGIPSLIGLVIVTDLERKQAGLMR